MDADKDDSPAPGSPASGSERIKAAVRHASARESEWPARVAAGIYAALDFAIREPALVRDLALEEPTGSLRAEGHCGGLVDDLTELLGSRAPRGRQPISTDKAAVRAIAHIVTDHVRTDRLEQLPAVGPDLVQLALLPYLGFAEAQHWAESTARWGSR